MSCPSNFVAKNAVRFSGSSIVNSVSIVSVSAASIVNSLWENIVKMFFSYFFGFMKLKLFEINLTRFSCLCCMICSIQDFISNEAAEEENDNILVFGQYYRYRHTAYFCCMKWVPQPQLKNLLWIFRRWRILLLVEKMICLGYILCRRQRSIFF